MKKLLITGLALFSITLLAADHYTSNQRRVSYRYDTWENLTREQRDQVHNTIDDFYRNRHAYIKKIDRKKLQADRLFLEEKVKWREVERLNTEISRLQSCIRNEHIKYHRKIFEITVHTSEPGMFSRGRRRGSR